VDRLSKVLEAPNVTYLQANAPASEEVEGLNFGAWIADVFAR
jgi:alpha/beta superfamily hydrolase